MIRVVCKKCGSKLNAKDELAGQTRKCPKCKSPVLIAPADGDATHDEIDRVSLDEAAVGQHAEPGGDSTLRHLALPEQLDRTSRYLICDRTSLVACWEANGQGWMLHTGSGMVSAVRNQALLPSQGDFKLIEMRLKTTDEGLKVSGLVIFQLALRWALPKLSRGDKQIISSITGLGFLNREQKNVVRNAMKDRFMYEIWKDSKDVLEYLDNTDYHSPGTSDS